MRPVTLTPESGCKLHQPPLLSLQDEARLPADVDLPTSIEAAVWKGNSFWRVDTPGLSTGFAALDAQLPGGGWPASSVTDLLQPQAGLFEWRLLGPALARATEDGGQLLLIGPPLHPHLPGLRKHGLDERKVVWVDVSAPAERLWATEQAIKANPKGAIVAWLPHARQEQIRRLQVCAQGNEAPVFLFRPASEATESSAAPLRLLLELGSAGTIKVRILKRRGPVHEGVITLEELPPSLSRVLTHRLKRAPIPHETLLPESDHAVLGGSDLPQLSSHEAGRA